MVYLVPSAASYGWAMAPSGSTPCASTSATVTANGSPAIFWNFVRSPQGKQRASINRHLQQTARTRFFTMDLHVPTAVDVVRCTAKLGAVVCHGICRSKRSFGYNPQLSVLPRTRLAVSSIHRVEGFPICSPSVPFFVRKAKNCETEGIFFAIRTIFIANIWQRANSLWSNAIHLDRVPEQSAATSYRCSYVRVGR